MLCQISLIFTSRSVFPGPPATIFTNWLNFSGSDTTHLRAHYRCDVSNYCPHWWNSLRFLSLLESCWFSEAFQIIAVSWASLLSRKSHYPNAGSFDILYLSCSFYRRKLLRAGETWGGAPAPGRAGPFIYSHAEDQALTGSDTCDLEICSPSVSYRLFLESSTGKLLFSSALTAKVFWDSWHTQETMCYSWQAW